VREERARSIVNNANEGSEEAVCPPVDEYRRERPKGAGEKRRRLGRVEVQCCCGAVSPRLKE
jgi:hypothetical protein